MPGWHSRALCRGETKAFDDEHAETVLAAKAVCVGCPVAGECLEVGLFESWGVWGGLTTEDRRALVKNLRRAQPTMTFDRDVRECITPLRKGAP